MDLAPTAKSKLLAPGPLVLDYDEDRWPFRQVVTEHLGFPPEQGDRHFSAPLLGRGTEQHTDMHKALYEISDSFREVHRSFVREFVLPLIGEPVVYQRIPNFRVQFPGNLGVRGMHRDREDGHDVNGLNFWLPLTPLEESNALWMEIAEGAGEHRCVPCQPGQVLVFDGANWEHGNRISTASTTRVSTDFRVVPAALFAPSSQRSMYRDVEFSVGSYYEEMSP